MNASKHPMRLQLIPLFLLLLASVSPACSGTPVAEGPKSEVVYVKEGQLFVYSLTTKTDRKLVELPGGAAAKDAVWSPDGKQVVFSYFPPPQRGVQPGTDLYSVNSDGTDLKPLRKHELPGELLETPYFLPDGSGVLIARFAPILRNNQYIGDDLAIVRLDLKTGELKPIVKDALMPTASPDGKKLAYIAISPTTASQSLWIANIDGSGAKQLVGDDQFAGIYWPRISPDASEVAFSGAQIPRVETFGRAAGNARGLAGVESSILRHGLPTDLYKVGIDGAKPVRLAKLDEDDPTPLWSADGKKLIVVGAFAIYTMDRDGQNLARLLEPGGLAGDWRGR